MRRSHLVPLIVLLAACGSRPRTQTAHPPQTPDQRLLAEARAYEELDAEAMHVRQRVRTYLVGLGAVARPARPEPRPEEPGPKPVDDAEWVGGEWIWEATAWVWHEGYWDWVGYVATTASSPREPWDGDRFRDHRRRGRFRDHRNGRDDTPSPSRTAVRDHRSGERATWERDTRDDPPPPKRSEEPSRPTRDREETTSWSSSSSGSSNVRDHRDKSDSKRDDDGPTIRDHRKK